DPNSEVSSTDGDISMMGTSRGTGTGHYGVRIGRNGVFVGTTGSGNIILEGIINGIGNNSEGIFFDDGGFLEASGTGNISFTADEINFTDVTVISGNGILQLQPLNDDLGITVGGITDDNRLNLDTNELNFLQNGFSEIIIGGDNSSGVITLADNVIFNDPVILRSPVGNGSIDTTGFTLTGSDTSITLQANQNITTGNLMSAGDITLTSNEIDLEGAVLGNGILTLEPATANQDIQIGNLTDSGASTLNLLDTDIAALQAGFTSINIGRADGTGTVTLNNGANFNERVNIVGALTLVGPEQDTVWEITSFNEGNLNSIFLNGLTFNNIENLTGGSFDDSFVFRDGATITGNLDGGLGNLTLAGDEIDFGGNVSGTGNLTIEPLTLTQSIQIGGIDSGSPNILDLTGTEVSLLQNGFTSITIGHANSSGTITLAGDTTFSDPVTLQSTNGGGSINHTGGSLTGADNATITLEANQNISTGNITNPGREIEIISNNGAVSTGNLSTSDFSGGEILIDAMLAITTGTIDTSGNIGDGGNVTLDPIGDIQVTSINTQGGNNGIGGDVDITAGRYFRATDSFSDRNGVLTSISSAGRLGGGDITIRHGGNGVIPFNLGDATINGTAAAITSGDFTIAPLQSFPFTQIQGNIQIISIDPSINPSIPLSDIPVNNPSIPLSDILDTLVNPATPVSNINISPINPIDLIEPYQPVTPLVSEEIPLVAVDIGVEDLEASFTAEFENQLGISNTPTATLEDVRNKLKEIQEATGTKPAVIYVFFASSGLSAHQEESSQRLQPQPTDELELILVTSEGKPIRHRVQGANRKQVSKTVQSFRRAVTDINISPPYKQQAKQLYEWLIAPLEAGLQAQEINNLVFIMDSGLRSLPISVLHDGNGFIIEKYSIGLMPTLSLTDTRYVDVRNTKMLAMGAAEFTDQNPLPAVPIELSTLTGQLWQGQSFLNEEFTLSKLKSARKTQPFGIVHLATHGEFKPGKLSNSYLQLWDTKLKLDQVPELGFHNPPVELLVLSACRTALGDPEAELGFAGLAVLAGVKSALGSLWYVSDEGTLGLMSNFYQQLQEAPIKAEALRQTQLAMLRGEVRLENGKLVSSDRIIPLPPELQKLGDKDLSHPYYWSAFTLIGSPW
ncbi:MAG: CHAT domain-containing protein, partial [Symploca sp. SIO1A3]|nr:CHAT domain-containing protein [Symploca sp. SIO1A3]